MNLVTKRPYLLPRDDRVQITDPVLFVNGSPQPVGTSLPEWDPAMRLHLCVEASLDFKEILSDCTLSRSSRLRLASNWRSEGSGLRGRGTWTDFDQASPSGSRSLEVQVEGSLLARNFILEVVLLLLERGNKSGPLAPSLPGSILWQHEDCLLLEGQGTRFPMEFIDFQSAGWLPSDAAWYLDWDPADFEKTFMGTVRLYLNARNERLRRALSENLSTDHAIREAIRFDVARTLIMVALENEDFLSNPSSYEDGTVGAIVRRLINVVFPTDDLSSLRDAKRQSQQRFECKLQSNVKLFAEN
jgi:hypothetical protein